MAAFATASKEISRNIFLIRREMDSEITYELDNARYKFIVFSMDFNGSENLRLTTPGMKCRVIVKPYSRVEVARLKVKNRSLASTLKVKYSCEEQDPSDIPTATDIPKREELAPGIVLTTKRVEKELSPGRRTEFQYSIYCGKNKRLKFTASFLGSSNMSLDDGSLSRTVIVNPYQEVFVGSLQSRLFGVAWTLKSKYSWVEETPSLGENTVRTTSHASPVPPAVPTHNNIKRDQVAQDIFLITKRIDEANGHTKFLYSIDSMKFKDLKVTLDFRGSSNLQLDNRLLWMEATVGPYQKKDVALLHTIRPESSWSLKQKISVLESEPASGSSGQASRTVGHHGRRGSYNSAFEKQPDGSWSMRRGAGRPMDSNLQSPFDAINKSLEEVSLATSRADQSLGAVEGLTARDRVMAKAKKTEFFRRASLDCGESAANPDRLLQLLQSIQLQQYYPVFLSEAMNDIGMLKKLAGERSSFHECMKDLGIVRMGHREAILQAISSC